MALPHRTPEVVEDADDTVEVVAMIAIETSPITNFACDVFTFAPIREYAQRRTLPFARNIPPTSMRE
jgi:hypothetical protein